MLKLIEYLFSIKNSIKEYWEDLDFLTTSLRIEMLQIDCCTQSKKTQKIISNFLRKTKKGITGIWTKRVFLINLTEKTVKPSLSDNITTKDKIY